MKLAFQKTQQVKLEKTQTRKDAKVKLGLLSTPGQYQRGRDQISSSTESESKFLAEATMADTAAHTSSTDAEQFLVLGAALNPGRCVGVKAWRHGGVKV